MLRASKTKSVLTLFLAGGFLAGCEGGATSTGAFDRTYDVAGPRKPDLSKSSRAIRLVGGAHNKRRIYREIPAHRIFFNNPEKQAPEISANPPIDQKPDIIRVGKELDHFNGVSIDYTIELPRNAEVSTRVASGAQSISGVLGPVKVQSASGSIAVSKIERSVQVSTASGSITAQDLGEDFRRNSVSGSMTVSSIKGDVRAHVTSGSTNISGPGGRVEAGTTSGTVTVTGAGNDVTPSSVSGGGSVQGNPSANSY